jgi:hypothetical protein
MKLSTSTSEQSKCEAKFCNSPSIQLTFSYTTINDRIEVCRNKGILQFTVNLRPAYIAGFNQSIV